MDMPLSVHQMEIMHGTTGEDTSVAKDQVVIPFYIRLSGKK